MKVANFILGVAVALAPLTARAQVGVDVYADVVVGEGIGSADIFYDQLSPYGVWVDDPHYGPLFIPSRANYVPYTNGHWAYTEVGFVWISDEPFAWATSHYGRWFYSGVYDRW